VNRVNATAFSTAPTTGDSDPILYRGRQVMVPLLDAKGQVVLDEHGQPRMIPTVRIRKGPRHG